MELVKLSRVEHFSPYDDSNAALRSFPSLILEWALNVRRCETHADSLVSGMLGGACWSLAYGKGVISEDGMPVFLAYRRPLDHIGAIFERRQRDGEFGGLFKDGAVRKVFFPSVS